MTTTASKTTTVDAAAQASIGAAARELHLPTVRTEAVRLAPENAGARNNLSSCIAKCPYSRGALPPRGTNEDAPTKRGGYSKMPSG